MRSIYNKSRPPTNVEIHNLIMKIKGEIDTIREHKDLEDTHDLSRASHHLDSFLNALEKQQIYKE